MIWTGKQITRLPISLMAVSYTHLVRIVKSSGYDLVESVLHPEEEDGLPVYEGYEPDRIFEHRPGDHMEIGPDGIVFEVE